MKRVVGIAELFVSDDPDDTIITYALGPCLGVTIYDPEVGVGGLIHCQLPSARGNEARPGFNPAQYVDTGILLLLEQVLALGAALPRLQVLAAGAAQVSEDLNGFRIAERNHTIFRKLMWKNGLLIAAEEIGGNAPRTMSLEIADGSVNLHSLGRTWELLPRPMAHSNLATSCAAADAAS